MTRAAYVGVDNLARNVKEIYVGVDGIARKVIKGYVGDENSIARQFWFPKRDSSGSFPENPYTPPSNPFNPDGTCSNCPAGSKCVSIRMWSCKNYFSWNPYLGGGAGGWDTPSSYYRCVYYIKYCTCSGKILGWGYQSDSSWDSDGDGTIDTGYSEWFVSGIGRVDLVTFYNWLSAGWNGNCDNPALLPSALQFSPQSVQSESVSNTNFDTDVLNPDTLTEGEESIVLQNAQLNNPVTEDIELERLN
jgi:hypothetical protein